MFTLLIATRNAHKLGEIRAILGEGILYRSLNDFPDAPGVNEDAPTFAGNATKKAVELAHWFAQTHSRRAVLPGSEPEPRREQILALADDSGLEVDALNGAPGVISARFAAIDPGHSGNSPDADNNAKLLRLLSGIPFEQRTARFRCVLALTPIIEVESEGASPVCYANESEIQTELFEGFCEGRIGLAPRGKAGFGYDPLFFPIGYEQTFAELGAEVKNQLSHRAQALAKLKLHLAPLTARQGPAD
jgi:XTP/dITP diphosphohydrolase